MTRHKRQYLHTRDNELLGDLAQLACDLAALADRADKLHFSPAGFAALATVAFRNTASASPPAHTSHSSHPSHRKPKGASR